MEITLSESEKLALVKMVDSVIKADEVIHDAEIEIMSQLMQRFNFNSAFVAEAKEADFEECLSVLTAMPKEKKSLTIQMLNVVAAADGFVHKKEMSLILGYCEKIGLCKKVV